MLTPANSPLRYVPRSYQVRALEFLKAIPRANLYIEPGLGKTAICLDAIVALGLARVLVIAPRLVALNTWSKEPGKWEQFRHLSVRCLTGYDAKVRREILKKAASLTVINLELVPWLVQEQTAAWPYDAVIFDESTRLQGFRSRQGTLRSKAIASVAFRSRHWWNLSGTPTANGLRQLWGPQWFIDRGAALGNSYFAFENRFYRRAAHGGMWAPLLLVAGADKEIRDRIAPTSFVVRAQDELDLAEPIDTTRLFDLPHRARSAYDAMRRHYVAEVDEGTLTAATAGVGAQKLRQISSGAVYLDEKRFTVLHEERIDLLRSLIEELDGEPLLVVHRYRHEREQLLAAFPDARDVRVAGAVEAWNAGKVPMLLAHPQSAGHGINLAQGGNHMVFFSPLSDAEHYGQIIERLGPARQLAAGFKRPVHIFHFHAVRTLDGHDEAVRQGRMTAEDAFLCELRDSATN